jgi:hypothetical protein
MEVSLAMESAQLWVSPTQLYFVLRMSNPSGRTACSAASWWASILS